MSKTKVIKGYKVFNPDWTCSLGGNTKQYEVGKTYKEDLKPSVCGCGMHFCEKTADCFNYYSFNPENKVAEVAALGEIDTDGEKSCTNKLKIVREISWHELLDMANTGKGCTGLGNTGDYNSGDYNSGHYNTGDWNGGHYNTGDYNSGNFNSGDCNSGNFNSGRHNSGHYNTGDWNSGHYNSGDWNSGDWNSGHYNSGRHNSGNWNTGNHNKGNHNVGFWNNADYAFGAFNLFSSNIALFGKLSEWTFKNLANSEAVRLMNQVEEYNLEWINADDMTEAEKKAHPEYKTTGGFLRRTYNPNAGIERWKKLNEREKEVIKSIPNFDKDIFKKITGIDVEE